VDRPLLSLATQRWKLALHDATADGQRVATLECRSVKRGVASKWVDVKEITDEQVQEARARLDQLIQTMPQVSDAVAMGFRWVANECPDANPSDLWHHVIYRHLLAEGWSDATWKRVSGYALERALVALYNDRLLARDLRMRILPKAAATAFLLTLGTPVGASKVDVFVEGRIDEEWMIFGGVHVKSSIAERIQDDVPASLALMSHGLLSIVLTMDAKSYPPPHGECVNYGELGARSIDTDKARIKRDYIEKTGQFDALFSFNLRTPPSASNTPSGKRIHTMGLHDPQPDQLVQFLVARWAAHPKARAP